MIATIKSELRKTIRRPAMLVGTGLVGAAVVLVYGVLWYQATHPSTAEHSIPLSMLYPDNFVASVMGAGYPLGAALMIVLGALVAGSEYSWGTMKTLFTQGPGRMTVWAGRSLVFAAWAAFMTAVLFAVGAACSVVVATFEGHAIAWPAIVDVAKGAGAIWLVFAVNGALGLALGTLFKQSAAALGVGIVYLLGVELIVVRLVDGINSGAYKWIGDLFMGPNSSALLQFSAPPANATITTDQAIIVLFAYLAGLLVIAAGLQRQRDVT